MSDFNDCIYHRITNILSPFSGVEFVPEDVLNKAADRGTRVHEWINNFYDGIILDTDSETETYVESFKKFHSQCPIKVIKKETRFFEDAIMVTGQIDMIAYEKDSCYIYDWKTSYKPGKTWPIQAAAYLYLVKDDHKIDGAKFVQLKKNGEDAEISYWSKDTLTDVYLPIFFKCLDLYKHFEMWKRPLLRKRKEMENQGNYHD